MPSSCDIRFNVTMVRLRVPRRRAAQNCQSRERDRLLLKSSRVDVCTGCPGYAALRARRRRGVPSIALSNGIF
jgi:hypothetical protein